MSPFSWLKSTDNPNSNLMGLITPWTILTWSLIIMAFMCECGEQVCGEFYLFNDKLNRYKWYFCSLDVQRIVLIFFTWLCEHCLYARFIQKGMNFDIVIHRNINGFNWSRFIFIRFTSTIQTVHGGFSYFMLIRQIDG